MNNQINNQNHLKIRLKSALHKNRNIILVFFLFTALVTAFISLTEDVLEKDTLAWDREVLLFINKGSTPFLNKLMPIITNFGGAIGVTLITVIFLAVFLKRKDTSRFILILSSVGGATILNIILKVIFKRQRPQLWELLVHEPTFSFPSGHAMASAALAFSLIIALRHVKYKKTARAILIIYMLTIGFSRMYLGVHYPTDIIGGWIVSLAWTLIVMFILNERLNEDYIL